MNASSDDFNDDAANCSECGGTRFVSSCWDEWACLHPDEGCDFCTIRCEFCLPAIAMEARQGGDAKQGSVEDDSAAIAQEQSVEYHRRELETR